jgi:hypothetical protein
VGHCDTHVAAWEVPVWHEPVVEPWLIIESLKHGEISAWRSVDAYEFLPALAEILNVRDGRYYSQLMLESPKVQRHRPLHQGTGTLLQKAVSVSARWLYHRRVSCCPWLPERGSYAVECRRRWRGRDDATSPA